MYLAELIVKNFRGIKDLAWRPKAGLNCLLGPGDATKSTILTAIELVLSPAWSIGIDETDCFDLTTANPISITATIADPPTEWQREDAFGRLMRGWLATDGVHDEPQPGDTLALTVRFTVTDDCEPHWHIIADREPTEKIITAKQRALCNTARIDTVDRQLTWSTGSLLTKATADRDQATATFTKAAKAAREAFRSADHPQLIATAAELQRIAQQYGVRPRGAFTAALDSKAMHLRAGCLTLHDTVVPSRLFGLGTRRILALALQGLVIATPAIALIDEFEHGLEPHRIRRLLRKLQTLPTIQTFMTTHSPVCVHELASTSLCIVRSNNNVTTVQIVPDEDLRKTIRAVPESLLARRLLICEGPTEVGIIRALDDHWATMAEPLASLGAIPLDGEGSTAPKRAKELRTLGYDVMIFADSDGSIAAEAPMLRQAGILVTMWAGSVCTEQQLFNDLPWQGVKEILAIVLQAHDEQSIRDQVGAKIPPGTTLDLTPPIMDWTDTPVLRDVLGRTAKKSGWYKQLHLGEEAGKILAAHLAAITATNTGEVVETLRGMVALWLTRRSWHGALAHPCAHPQDMAKRISSVTPSHRTGRTAPYPDAHSRRRACIAQTTNAARHTKEPISHRHHRRMGTQLRPSIPDNNPVRQASASIPGKLARDLQRRRRTPAVVSRQSHCERNLRRRVRRRVPRLLTPTTRAHHGPRNPHPVPRARRSPPGNFQFRRTNGRLE